MATRAGLDASHAPKSITAWREKKPSYKGKLNRICRGTFSLRLILLGLCAFSTVLQSIFSLSFWVFLLLTLASERHRPQRRHLVFSGSLRKLLWCELEGHVESSWSKVRDERRFV